MIENILDIVIENNASDLHLVDGYHPIIRVDGVLVPLSNIPELNDAKITAIGNQLMSEYVVKRFIKNKSTDFSYSYKKKARFRINIYKERGKTAIAMRHLPTEIRTLKDLKLPERLADFTQYIQGLFLIVGPTGSGKSTTLASMLNIINETRASHILTIEDPIEYIFTPKKSLITQREIINDTNNFHSAIIYGLRQDPDVIMVGEMRDLETISTAITAAETGHLVFATLHTNSAAQTIDRIIDGFPSYHQNQIRMQLSAILLGVISQRLIPKKQGGVIPALEIMIANGAIKTLIRDNKTHQINTVISTSIEDGMISLDRYLEKLLKKEEIDIEIAKIYSLEKTIERKNIG